MYDFRIIILILLVIIALVLSSIIVYNKYILNVTRKKLNILGHNIPSGITGGKMISYYKKNDKKKYSRRCQKIFPVYNLPCHSENPCGIKKCIFHDTYRIHDEKTPCIMAGRYGHGDNANDPVTPEMCKIMRENYQRLINSAFSTEDIQAFRYVYPEDFWEWTGTERDDYITSDTKRDEYTSIGNYDYLQHSLKYQSDTKSLTPAVHIGQRKLFLSEVDFLNRQPKNVKYCIYAGSAPGHKTHLLSRMFPYIKFILIDPNEFEINLDGYATHRNKPHPDIIHLYHNPKYKYYGNAYHGNLKLAEMSNNNKDNMLEFIRKSTKKIFILEDFFNDDTATFLKRLGPCTFISDIRSNVSGFQFPKDLDIIWNTSMMFNWMVNLQPEISMIKYRAPFFETTDNSVEEHWREYKNDFDESKKYGIDFVNDYLNKKVRAPVGRLCLQAFPGRTSTELRLIIKKENLQNIVKYPWKDIENRMFYYNRIGRVFVHHANPNADRELGFCHCNDCALENVILSDYIKLMGNNISHDWNTVPKLVKMIDKAISIKGNLRTLKSKHLGNIWRKMDDKQLSRLMTYMWHVVIMPKKHKKKVTKMGNVGRISDKKTTK